MAEFREVKMMLLQFGEEVRVMGPEELREVIREEIGGMGRVYGLGKERVSGKSLS